MFVAVTEIQAETAFRQLSDGLAAMDERRRKAVEMLWSQCGAGAVLVTAMMGRLFYRSICISIVEPLCQVYILLS